MHTIKPFRAIRPTRDLANKVNVAHSDSSASRDECRDRDNKYSFLHISRAYRELPEELENDESAVAAKAKENLSDFRKRGILIKDETECMYIYKLTSRGNSQTGLIACIDVNGYNDGRIKRHELTRVDKVEAQIKQIKRCGGNIEPVLLVHKAKDTIKCIMQTWVDSHGLEYDFFDRDDVHHELWKVGDENVIASLVEAFDTVESFYIADGHHRVAAAAEQANRSESDEKRYVMTLMFPDDEVTIFDYNRAVSELNGMNPSELIEKLEAAGFDVSITGKTYISPDHHGEFSMFLDGNWYTMRYMGEMNANDLVSNIGVSFLQDHVLAPILGVEDPRRDERLSFVSGIKGIDNLVAAAGERGVAFAIPAVSMEEIMEIADAGMTMPPKSTCFDPKPGCGLMMYELSE